MPMSDKKIPERWTDEEHTLFLEGMSKYGRQWTQVAKHIGTKTPVQIRSHAQKYFNRLQRCKADAGDANYVIPEEVALAPWNRKSRGVSTSSGTRAASLGHTSMGMASSALRPFGNRPDAAKPPPNTNITGGMLEQSNEVALLKAAQSVAIAATEAAAAAATVVVSAACDKIRDQLRRELGWAQSSASGDVAGLVLNKTVAHIQAVLAHTGIVIDKYPGEPNGLGFSLKGPTSTMNTMNTTANTTTATNHINGTTADGASSWGPPNNHLSMLAHVASQQQQQQQPHHHHQQQPQEQPQQQLQPQSHQGAAPSSTPSQQLPQQTQDEGMDVEGNVDSSSREKQGGERANGSTPPQSGDEGDGSGVGASVGARTDTSHTAATGDAAPMSGLTSPEVAGLLPYLNDCVIGSTGLQSLGSSLNKNMAHSVMDGLRNHSPFNGGGATMTATTNTTGNGSSDQQTSGTATHFGVGTANTIDCVSGASTSYGQQCFASQHQHSQPQQRQQQQPQQQQLAQPHNVMSSSQLQHSLTPQEMMTSGMPASQNISETTAIGCDSALKGSASASLSAQQQPQQQQSPSTQTQQQPSMMQGCMQPQCLKSGNGAYEGYNFPALLSAVSGLPNSGVNNGLQGMHGLNGMHGMSYGSGDASSMSMHGFGNPIGMPTWPGPQQQQQQQQAQLPPHNVPGGMPNPVSIANNLNVPYLGDLGLTNGTTGPMGAAIGPAPCGPGAASGRAAYTHLERLLLETDFMKHLQSFQSVPQMNGMPGGMPNGPAVSTPLHK